MAPVEKVLCFVILLLFFLLGGEWCDCFSSCCSALHSWGHMLGLGCVLVAGVSWGGAERCRLGIALKTRGSPGSFPHSISELPPSEGGRGGGEEADDPCLCPAGALGWGVGGGRAQCSLQPCPALLLRFCGGRRGPRGTPARPAPWMSCSQHSRRSGSLCRAHHSSQSCCGSCPHSP